MIKASVRQKERRYYREMDRPASSDYFYKLDAKLEVRYLEKTAFIRKEDPYALKNDAFCLETSCFPALRYVIFADIYTCYTIANYNY